MRSTMTHNPDSMHRAARLMSLAAVLTLVSLQSTTRADVSVSGDTSPPAGTISDAGGPVGEDLIIGDTGIAGLFMDFAPPFSGFLLPLESPNGIIGNAEGSIGAATFEDFQGGDWIVENTLTVGNGGQGFLDLFDSASVTATDFIVGGLETGVGVTTINGQGSRIITDGFIVGDEGDGTLDVNNRAILISGNTGGSSIIGNQFGSVGVVNVSGPGTLWAVGTTSDNAPLFVGNGSGILSTGQGTLNIANQGLVRVAGSTLIDRSGHVVLSGGGRLRKLPSATGIIAVEGELSGDGFVDGPVEIGFLTGLGEVRSSAGIANTRERLVFNGPVINGSTVFVDGGEMDFNATLTNNFEVIVRDGIMRFPLGLANNAPGSITIGGNSTLHGTITNNGGDIHILSGSESLFVGDLIFTAAGFLGLSAGSAPGTLDITGGANLNGALISLDYSAGVLAQPGDSYQILYATDGITNFTPQQAAAGGRLWDITLNASMDRLFATATPLIAAPVGADFNGDGIVNELDLQIWQTNYGRTSPPSLAGLGDADGDGDVDGRDLFIIQRKFGGPPLVAALANVPEPTSLVMLLGTAALGLARRRR